MLAYSLKVLQSESLLPAGGNLHGQDAFVDHLVEFAHGYTQNPRCFHCRKIATLAVVEWLH
jgi:hypothetical protein